MKTYKEFVSLLEKTEIRSVKSYEYLSKEKAKEVNSLMKDIEKAFRKYFPKGYFLSYHNYEDHIYSKNQIKLSIGIQTGLIGNRGEKQNGREVPDPLYNANNIYFYLNSDKSYTDYELENIYYGISLYSKNRKDDREKTFIIKNKKGNKEKIVKIFDDLFKKIAKFTKENENNLYLSDVYDYSKYTKSIRA